MTKLQPEAFAHYVDYFNSMEDEGVVNLIPNAQSWQWMKQNIPLFECPDKAMEQMYYFRWWTFRKHLKQTPAGIVITEFITPVRHGGTYNTISCALGFHLAEGRWLRDQSYLNQYTRFWFDGVDQKPEPKFHNYSSWFAAAAYERFLVNGDHQFLLDLFPKFIDDYLIWETEKRLPDGMFWQYDVRDGMEESISGSRKHKNRRPTINTYMYANALAIAEMAVLAGKPEIAAKYRSKAAALKNLVQDKLWDANGGFFKVLFEDDTLSTAREAIGFIPWCFNLPDPGFEQAWAQLTDPRSFDAPFGITTAERRHPQFRSHGVGQCEWDGAVWPFATSQTLNALANVLRHYDQSYVTRQDYLKAMSVYVKSQHRSAKPYIGEYLDEMTGEWLKGDNPRSFYYNHSTFCDLIITGLIGLCPRADNIIEIHPLLPADAWEWFFVQDLPYHGRSLTVVWDHNGKKYERGAGLSIYANGQQIAHSTELGRLTGVYHGS